MSLKLTDREVLDTLRSVLEHVLKNSHREEVIVSATPKADGVNPFGLFLSAHETKNIAGAFSTWFECWGGVMGAAHSVEAWPNGIGWKPGRDRHEWPLWTKQYKDNEIIIRPGGLDAALFGCKVPELPPTKLSVGVPLRLRGYPAGVTVQDHYEVRNGFAYMDRPEELLKGEAPSWIVQFIRPDTPTIVSQLAMGGMSGGTATITGRDGEEVVGILITQNTRSDLDGDGVGDHSSDIVELYDVWVALKSLS